MGFEMAASDSRAIIWGIILIVVAVVTGLRKPSKSEAERIARLDRAMMKTKDDPIEPARFVP
jgi:hypothetical protein